MELGEEQIEKVERYLNVKGLIYVDFKFEILDHLISEIEQKIVDGGNFESAFNSVKTKWNSQLEPTHSWIIGTAFTAPEIVVKIAEKIYFPFFILLMFFSVLMYISIFLLEIKGLDLFNENIYFILNVITGMLTVLSCIVFGSMIFDKKKTIYSFLVKPLMFGVFVLPLILTSFSLGDYVCVLNLILFVICVIFLLIFNKKHKNEKEKFNMC